MKNLFLALIFSMITFNLYSAPYEIIIETPVESVEGTHLEESTVGLEKLTTDGASDNDVLFFDGLDWKPAPLTGLTFRGTWDPVTNSPKIIDNTYEKNSLPIDAISGDYFIVTDSLPDQSWNRGDWIIFNGKDWERINNTGAVLSVFGRKGNVVSRANDYKWEQIDKTGSSIFDLTNIELPLGPLSDYDEHVFKWNDAIEKFELSQDNAGMAGPVNSSHVMDGTIQDIDISPTANIQISKIDGFSTLGKLKETGGIVSDLRLDNKKLITGSAGKVIIRDASGNDVEIILSELKKKFDDLVILFNGKEDQFNGSGVIDEYLSGGVDTSGNRLWKNFNLDIATEGSTNKFQTDLSVWSAKLPNYDVTNAPTPLEDVKETDTLLEGLQKLEALFSQGPGSVLVHTNQIIDDAVDFKKHFSKAPTDSGFLYLGGTSPFSWSLKMTSGLQFKGEKATTDFPLPTPALSGDYYVITNSADVSGVTWNQGDWAIYDGSNYLQINNTGKVLDFNGRKGTIGTCPDATSCVNSYDYSWKMLDFAGSKLEDIEDVSAPTTANAPSGTVHHILKRVGGKWELAEDDSGVPPGSTVSASSIADDTIMDSHVGNFILIDQIKDLRTDLDNLLDRTGGDMTGDINLGGNDLLGISTFDSKDFSKVIDYAVNFQTFLDGKEDSLNLNGDPASVITVAPNSSTKSAVKLDTNNLVEGSINLYFTEQRVFDAVGAPSGSGSYTPSNHDIVYGGSSPDTISIAFEKLNSQIANAGNLPANSVTGDSLRENSIPPEKLAPANNSGETILYRNGDWEYSSISGLNLKNNWNLANANLTAANAPDSDLVAGDYYVITGAGKIDGEDYSANDWAVYNGAGKGFSKISNAVYITSFNGRTGDIVACPNSPVTALCQDSSGATVFDYDWNKIVTGTDATVEKISHFEDVEYTLADTPLDRTMLLAWDAVANKWKPAVDKQGLSSAPVAGDFSVGLNSQKKAVTNEDIQSIDFEDIKDLSTFFSTNFVDITTDPVVFPTDLDFDSTGNYTISGIGEIINPSDATNKFTPAQLNTACSSLDPTLYEKTFSDELTASATMRKVLNGEKKFVTLKPENLTGNVAAQMYDPDKVRTLPITGFVQANADYDLVKQNPTEPGHDPNDDTTPGWGTKLIDVFNKLAGKVESFVQGESAGSGTVSGVNSIDDSKNGQLILLDDSSTVNLADSIAEGFEITFKRVDPSGVDPANIEIKIASSKKINGKNEITLASNYSSVTLKKIVTPAGSQEFIILRKNGTIN